MKNFNIYQVIIALISLSMIFTRILKLVKGEASQTFIKFFMTAIVWSGILVFALFPNLAQEISKKFGMGENLNTLIFLVFVVIFLVLFKIINLAEKIEQNISKLVREEALGGIRNENIRRSDKGSNKKPIDFEE